MALVTIPYSFTPGTTIVSAQVNANFAAAFNELNGNLDSTNIASVAESKVVFSGTGHAHSGGVGGAPVQDVIGANIASAATLAITTDGNAFTVTGTTNVTALSGRNAGVFATLMFSGALTLTHNAVTLILQDGKNLFVKPGDVIRLESLGAGNWREVARRIKTIPKGTRSGLQITTCAGNTITIAAGYIRDSTDVADIALPSAMAKDLSVVWGAGTGNGGRFTAGALAAGQLYHAFAIIKDADGSVDWGYDTTVNAANKPAGYSYFRRLFSLAPLDATPQIRAMTQNGRRFTLLVPPLDITVTTPGTAAVVPVMSVPTGLTGIVWRGRVKIEDNSVDNGVLFSDPAQTDTAPSITVAPLAQIIVRNSGGLNYASGQLQVGVNTLGQVRYRFVASNANTKIQGVTDGWDDDLDMYS